MKPPYYLLEDGQPTGPHSLIVLQQKAEIRVIGPDSSVRPLLPADAPWLPIRAIVDLHLLLFPPKTPPALGAAHFTATNPAADTANHPVRIESLLQDNTARLVATEHFNPSRHPSRRARRHRTYLLTMLGVAASAGALYRFGPFPRGEMLATLLGSSVALVALLCYWIIYHISDFRS